MKKLLLFLLFIPIALALPNIEPIPSQMVLEGESLNFYINASGFISLAIQNNPINSELNGQYFTFNPSYLQSGNYTVNFIAINGSDSSTRSVDIGVINVNRAPIFSTQGDKSIPENTTIIFNVNAVDPDSDTITYTASNLPAGASFNQFSHEFSWTPTFSQAGSYSISFGASDSLLQSTMNVNIYVADTSTAPNILWFDDSTSIGSNIAAIKFNTSSDAMCRYSLTQQSFSGMLTMDQSGFREHKSAISGLSFGSSTVYVRCKSSFGDETFGSRVFDINMGPTVQISLNPPSPLKPELVKVTLLSSSQLATTPSLTYFYDDAPSSKMLVSLDSVDSSTTLFSGYMIIPDNAKLRTGTFEFSGTDVFGRFGNKITSGKTFIVDNVMPPAAQTIKAESRNDGSIKLTWYYVGEAVRNFRIYRSTTSDLGYLDFYANSLNGSFVDSSVTPYVTYYYKVAAEDRAGNIGDLSPITSASANVQSNNSQNVVVNVKPLLSSKALSQLNLTIKMLEKQILDIQFAQNSLSDISDTKLKGTIEKLKLIDDINRAKADLESQKKELLAISPSEYSDEELSRILELANVKMKKYNQTIIVSAKITSTDSNILSATDTQIEDLVQKVMDLRKLNATKDGKKDIIKDAKLLTSKLRISQSGYVVTLLSISGLESKKSFIEKSIVFEGSIDPGAVMLVEKIPKDVASDYSQLKMQSEPDLVLENDPIIAWRYPKIPADPIKIAFALDSQVDQSALRNTITLIMPDLETYKEKPSLVSGLFAINVGSVGLATSATIVSILIIIALAGSYLYLRKRNENISLKLQPLESEKKDDLPAIKIQESILKAPVKEAVKVESKTVFYLDNGVQLKDARELLDALKYMPFYVYIKYCNPNKNDFSIWLKDIGEAELAQKIEKSLTPESTRDIIINHINSKL